MPDSSSAPLLANDRAVFPYRTKQQIFRRHQNNKPGMPAIVSDEYKIAYVYVPKNACSSLKLFFYELIHGHEFDKRFNQIHGQFSHAACDFEKFAENRDYFKFLIVRDPIERFVSAYNNRVLFYKELSKPWLRAFSPDFPKVLAELEAKSLEFTPGIGEFVRHLEDYMRLNDTIRHHVIPQHHFFHGRPDIFDRVYNIRQLPQLAEDLSARIGRAVKLPLVQETKGLKNQAKISDLGAAELNRLREFYKEDYRILGSYL
jgi:hypothetical protein